MISAGLIVHFHDRLCLTLVFEIHSCKAFKKVTCGPLSICAILIDSPPPLILNSCYWPRFYHRLYDKFIRTKEVGCKLGALLQIAFTTKHCLGCHNNLLYSQSRLTDVSDLQLSWHPRVYWVLL